MSRSWSRKPTIDEALEKTLMDWLKELVDAGLTSRDLTLAWLSRWLFPLQAREHKMCFYSGSRDPTHISMEAMSMDSLRSWAALMITERIGWNWRFGHQPFSRSERATEVSRCSFACLQSFRPAAV